MARASFGTPTVTIMKAFGLMIRPMDRACILRPMAPVILDNGKTTCNMATAERPGRISRLTRANTTRVASKAKDSISMPTAQFMTESGEIIRLTA